mmetsp:Transcript_13747/g.17286  ORF Transcript_13747/g.17286 Transcript_13747/m.17286 type:complete len:459 (-) Transcript_13747:312-1688(-)
MKSNLLPSIVWLSSLLLIPSFRLSTASVPEERFIHINNDSGHRIHIFWISTSNEAVPISNGQGIQNGATFPLNSFVGHSFEAREIASPHTKECHSDDGVCRSGYFTVNQNDDQNIFIRKGMVVDHVDNLSRAAQSATELMTLCESQAVEKARYPNANASQVIVDLKECVEMSVSKNIRKATEDIAFQANVREGMSALLENYTCADETLPTSEFTETRQWDWKGEIREVGVLHERDASIIHLVKNFVSEEECNAMQLTAEGRLHHATTADGEGGSKLSDSRKAMQAGIKVPWEKEAEGDPIATMSRRVYDYTNYATGFGLSEHGQEELMSIQYFGRGEDEEAPDRYTPHCDGDCKGLPHKEGQRVATMVMYCTVPEKGGATNFMNSGVHVVPEKGNAIFFSYMNPKTHIMDKGFTQHSGCPVIHGIKRIVTQWMRYGVTREVPWNAYNTLGIKYSEQED